MGVVAQAGGYAMAGDEEVSEGKCHWLNSPLGVVECRKCGAEVDAQMYCDALGTIRKLKKKLALYEAQSKYPRGEE